MCDGYDAGGGDDHSEIEDEILCEYVDDTMDPLVRSVFEEYLQVNPELRDHVECLRRTRLLLCRYGCGCKAPGDLHDKLRREITCELMQRQDPFFINLSDRLRSVATFTSAAAILLVFGVVAGLSQLSGAPEGPQVLRGTVVVTPAQPSANGSTLSGTRYLDPRYSTFAPFSTVRSILSHSDAPAAVSLADTLHPAAPVNKGP